MKRLISAAAAVVSCAALAGCSAKLPEGYDKFTAARDKYEKLDSARVTMTDLDSGSEIMEFSFYFNGSDEMVFSYYSCWDGEVQQAYSNGAEFFYKEDGDEKWSVIGPADENYVYNVYNRGYRYPYAEGRVFFLAGEAVASAEVTENENGTSITYVYDPEKLNSASMPGVQEEIAQFSALTTTLDIGADGIVRDFTESGTVTSVTGEILTLNMMITVSDANDVFEVANPVDEIYRSGEKPVQTEQVQQ
ncbi:MAG: hypothetical protein ACI4WS_06865 [Oscillospiraceae bacterium]